jgi:signal transduction histidine kinase
MSVSELCLVHANELESQRADRAVYATRYASLLGVSICLLTVLFDLLTHPSLLTLGTATTGAGCWISHLLSRRARPGRMAAWVPLVTGLWFAQFPICASTGGMQSPFFGLHLITFVGAGVSLQSRHSPCRVLAALLANLALWLSLEAGGLLPAVSMAPGKASVVAYILSYIAGCCAIGYALLRAERDLARSLLDRRRELLETRIRLEQAAQMAELGDLLSATAHEVAQPLQVVSFGAASLRRALEGEPRDLNQLRALAAQLEQANRRATQVLTQLRDFSRRDDFKPAPMDLREPLNALAPLMRSHFALRSVELRLDLPAQPIWVLGDGARIQQVLLNLLNNAREASQSAPRPEVRIWCERVGETWARIGIANNGDQIPPSVQQRLFRENLTTKARGQGTGIGLRICDQLVSQHGGRILFSSQPGRTVFNLDLPALRTELADRKSADASVPTASETPSIPERLPDSLSARLALA